MTRSPALCLVASLALAWCAAPLAAEEANEGLQPSDFFGMGLGFDAPLGAENGRPVPVLYGLYWSGSPGVTPLAAFAELKTADLTVRLASALGGGAFASWELRTAFLLHNAAPYFYDHGRFDADRSYRQSFVGTAFELGFRPLDRATTCFFVGARQFSLGKDRGSSPFSAPPDHIQAVVGCRFCYDDTRFHRGLLLREGLKVTVEAMAAHRDVWGPWPGDACSCENWGEKRDWGLLHFKASLYLRPDPDHNLVFTLNAGLVEDADRFSAMRVGSTVGQVALSGAAYGELAVDRHCFLRTEYSFDLWTDARLTVGFDVGAFRDLKHRERGAVGFSITVQQRIFFGIPVALTYGYCPEAIRPGITGGHEILLLVKIGFAE